jgi:isoleucyl-tRNA synthetase
VTPDLEKEGLAREFVRQVQTMRKEAGFSIEDHITIRYKTNSDKLRGALSEFGEYVQRETLSDTFDDAEPITGDYTSDVALEGQQVRIGVKQV